MVTSPRRTPDTPPGGAASPFDPSISTVREVYASMARQTPDRPIVFAPDRESLTLAGLVALTERTVAALNTAGLRPGDRAVIAIPSSVEAGTAYLTISTGITILPLSPDLAADHYASLIAHVQAAAVIVQRGHPTRAREVAQHLGVQLIEITPVAGAPAGTFEVLGTPAATGVPPQFAGPDDLALLLQTSGTTGIPKLVPWSHGESLAQFSAYFLARKGGEEVGTIILLQPLYLMGGLAILSLAVVTGGGFTCLPQLTADAIYRALAHYRPRTLSAVPAILELLVQEAPNHQDELRQLALERIAVGSAALPERLFAEVRRTFGAVVQITYGMTESPIIAGTTQESEDMDHRPGSVGKPYPIVQIVIADESGTPLPQGEVGEVTVRSPMLFRGYLDNPEANAEAFRDGWFRTGDAGYLDADGYLYLVGRIKEAINRGGGKISPTDVETAIERHPAVREAAAFGFPHAALGEDLAVAVVLADPAVTESELRRFIANHLPLTQVPSRFVVVEALPRTALGKLRRNALATQFADTLRR